MEKIKEASCPISQMKGRKMNHGEEKPGSCNKCQQLSLALLTPPGMPCVVLCCLGKGCKGSACMENKPQTFPHLHPGSPSFGFHAWLEFAIAKSQITGSGHPSVQAELVRLGQEAQSCPSSEHGAGCGSRGWSRSQTHERCLRPEPHRDTLFCQSTARLCALQGSFCPCPGPGRPTDCPGHAPSILRAALLWHIGVLGDLSSPGPQKLQPAFPARSRWHSRGRHHQLHLKPP